MEAFLSQGILFYSVRSKNKTSSTSLVCGNKSTGTAFVNLNGFPGNLSAVGRQRLLRGFVSNRNQQISSEIQLTRQNCA
jgi:hypothetical protein